MDLKGAKELLHIQAWLVRADEIVRRGKDAYLADALLPGSWRLAHDEAWRGCGENPAGRIGTARVTPA